MKKKLLLLTSGLLAILFVNAQTNSDASGNVNNGTAGYIYNFSAGDAENCIPSHLSTDDATDITLSVNNGFLTVTQSNTSDNPGWHGTNFDFVNGNCSAVTLDLSGANGDSVKFVVNSSVAVNECNVYFCDNIGRCTDGTPKSMALVAGSNTVEFGGFTWQDWQANSVDNTNITRLKIQFRDYWEFVNTDGTFTISNIQVGDQTGLTITGVEEETVDASLTVYPNPASSVLNVAFESLSGAEVSLLDITGSTAATVSADAGQTTVSLNTSELSGGLYILSIATADGVVTRKVIIE